MRCNWGIVVALVVAGCGGKVDDDAAGSRRSNATGAVGDAPAAAAAGGEAPAPPRAGSGPLAPVNRPACALKTPIRQDFDKGLLGFDDWGGAPGGLGYDPVTPIAGANSVKIDVARAVMYRGFLTRSLPASCAFTMNLSIRAAAPLFASGENATIVRLSSAPGFFDLVLAENGRLSFVEAQSGTIVVAPGGGSGPAPSVGIAHDIGSLTADVAASIVVTIDLTTNDVSGSVAPMTKSAATPAVSSKLTIPHGSSLTNIVVGMFAGSAKTGTYVLDDFSLE